MAVVTGSNRVQTSFTQVKSSGVITPLSLGASVGFTPNYGNGTGANQVDLMYSASVSLASTTLVLDLTALTDLAGNAANMTRVREIIIQSTDTAVAKILKLYATVSVGWIFIPPVANYQTVVSGGCYHMSDPLTVGASNGLYTGGSNKSITIDSVSQTCAFNIIIAGCSAVS